MVAAAYGCRCAVAVPDDAAFEKGALLEALGARVLRQRPVSIAHPQHFVNVARRLAAEAAASSPAKPGSSDPDSCGSAALDIGLRLGQFEENGMAALGRAGRGAACAAGGDSEGDCRAQPGKAMGPGAAAVDRNGGYGASAASLGSACLGEGTANAGGNGGSGSGSGGGGAVFADQFENLANYRAHLATGAEVWAQVPRCNVTCPCAQFGGCCMFHAAYCLNIYMQLYAFW